MSAFFLVLLVSYYYFRYRYLKNKEKMQLYDNIKKRWQAVSPDLDGVLGGFGELSGADLTHSRFVIEKMLGEGVFVGGRALDCCCGIGRVSEGALLQYFDKVDMFDQEEKFIDFCRKNLVGEKIGHIDLASLQNYQFREKYEVIWSQWGFENLEDADLLDFLKRCKAALAPGGVIVAKENVCVSTLPYQLMDDCKIRSVPVLREFFNYCGFEIVFEDAIADWPEDFYDVVTFVLRPF